jgi:hypothetical protein
VDWLNTSALEFSPPMASKSFIGSKRLPSGLGSVKAAENPISAFELLLNIAQLHNGPGKTDWFGFLHIMDQRGPLWMSSFNIPAWYS